MTLRLPVKCQYTFLCWELVWHVLYGFIGNSYLLGGPLERLAGAATFLHPFNLVCIGLLKAVKMECLLKWLLHLLERS